MGVQRIQETSAASYGKSVEAATSGSSNAAGGNGVSQSVENITTPWKTEIKNSADTKTGMDAGKDKDDEMCIRDSNRICASERFVCRP